MVLTILPNRFKTERVESRSSDLESSSLEAWADTSTDSDASGELHHPNPQLKGNNSDDTDQPSKQRIASLSSKPKTTPEKNMDDSQSPVVAIPSPPDDSSTFILSTNKFYLIPWITFRTPKMNDSEQFEVDIDKLKKICSGVELFLSKSKSKRYRAYKTCPTSTLLDIERRVQSDVESRLLELEQALKPKRERSNMSALRESFAEAAELHQTASSDEGVTDMPYRRSPSHLASDARAHHQTERDSVKSTVEILTYAKQLLKFSLPLEFNLEITRKYWGAIFYLINVWS